MGIKSVEKETEVKIGRWSRSNSAQGNTRIYYAAKCSKLYFRSQGRSGSIELAG